VLLRCPRRQRSNEIRSDIALGAARCDGVAEYTSTDFPGAVSGVDDALGFDPLEWAARSGLRRCARRRMLRLSEEQFFGDADEFMATEWLDAFRRVWSAQ
jgi:hypothetical protein